MDSHTNTHSPEDSDYEDSSAQGLISDGQSEMFRKRKSSDYNVKWLAAVIISFILGAVIGVQVLFFIRQTSQNPANVSAKCLEQHSYFSPALRDVSPEYLDVKFNGTLDFPSIYRGDPNPDLDAAWNRLENVKIMSISERDLLSAGYSKDSVKLPNEYGGGFMASIEVNHQLHCLNFVRKALHWDYYQFKSVEFSDAPKMVQTHLGHCIEMLRQTLMCHADVGVIAHRWVKNYSNPYPDFNVMHKCRNFEEVLQWGYDHEVGNVPDGHRWKPQAGEKIWESPP